MNMRIEWRDALSVDNNGPIDRDHKYLIKLINELGEFKAQSSRNIKFNDILSELKTYTIVHFAREEKLQKAANYPEHEDHKKEHHDLIHKLDVIISVAKKNIAENKSKEQAEVIFEQTQKFLKNWLLQHVVQHDLKMKDYVVKMQGEAKSLPDIEGSNKVETE